MSGFCQGMGCGVHFHAFWSYKSIFEYFKENGPTTSMAYFLGHGKGIFKIKDLLDQKADFDNFFRKWHLRYSFLWENFEISILALFDLENRDEENRPGFWQNGVSTKIRPPSLEESIFLKARSISAQSTKCIQKPLKSPFWGYMGLGVDSQTFWNYSRFWDSYGTTIFSKPT